MASTIVNTDRLLTTPEVSEMTGLAVNTLQNMRSRGLGEGPTYVKIGRAARYRMSQVQEWLESLETIGGAA